MEVETGREVATAVYPYSNGVIDGKWLESGVPLEPDWALQDPQDYLRGFQTAISDVLEDSGIDPGDVIGIVHSHSPYATAFAAVNMPIPVYLTAQADEFGGPIPCGGFTLIGGEKIGKVVVKAIGDSPAVLLKNHGVFTVGPTAEDAVKAAVMVEDAARTTWLALQIGHPDVIADEDVARLHRRYQHVYGQR